MKDKKKWKRGIIPVDLTVREAMELRILLEDTKGFKQLLNKIIKASDWYFDYPYRW